MTDKALFHPTESTLNDAPSRQNPGLKMNPATEPDAAQIRSSQIKMLWMFAIISAPVIAAYLVYAFHQPVGRSNYGTLLQPAQVETMAVKSAAKITAAGVTPLPDVPAQGEFPLAKVHPLQHRWLMVTVGPSSCDDLCARRLLIARQVRWTTGVDQERIERVWLLTDDGTPSPKLLGEHRGMYLLRVDRKALEAYFKSEPGRDLSDHLYIVDPLGNLMMRYPKDIDPERMKKDINKLLLASRVG